MKFLALKKPQTLLPININMRCIEISFKIAVRGKLPEININMRCIEIIKTTEREFDRT